MAEDAGAKGGVPWAGLAMMAVTFVLIAGALEVGFRMTEDAGRAEASAEESWAVYDEDLAYRNKPGFGDHNAEGHRDHPLDVPKRRFRVLLLGDSVPYYGDDLDDTYPGRLEGRLAEMPGLPPVEVVNAGVRGYTIHQERLYLEKYGADLAPDLVAVSFVLNDVHRILHRFTVVDGEIVGQEYGFAEEAVQTVESPLYQLARKSRLLVWLRGRLAIFDDLVDLYTTDGFSFDYRPDFNTAWREDRWPLVEEELSAMVALGRERGFRVCVVVFPFADQLREDYLARDRDYVLRPQRKLAELGARLGVPVLDLFDALEAERDMDPDRVHLTAHGRGVAAERIAAFLAAERLVPAARPAGAAAARP